tara:strand:+ start:22 stop:1203 length:1182 start_codon:yes stop_codon:yes gene_type:complete
MWFNKEDFSLKERRKKIILNNLYGYILPHAGTTHTKNILKHTLQFCPSNKRINNIKNILIMYLPSPDNPNVGSEFHEFYVLKKVLTLYFPNKKIIGYNVINPPSEFKPEKYNKSNTLFILSVDFSHFLFMQEALIKENCAAHSLMFQRSNTDCIDVVDDIRTFNRFYKLFPFAKDLVLQWIGRSRSSGIKGVGYLSFLLRSKPYLLKKKNKPSGFFVTAYDKKMNARECLGNTKRWNKTIQQNLIDEVIQKAKTTSRLTSGMYVGKIPITNYTITYLYKEKHNIDFIRGYHAIFKDALYLPGVFLEHTYENGEWIKENDNFWKTGNKFNLSETFNKLFKKSQKYRGGNIQLLQNKIKSIRNKRKNYRKRNKTRKLKYKKPYILFKTQVLHCTL